VGIKKKAETNRWIRKTLAISLWDRKGSVGGNEGLRLERF